MNCKKIVYIDRPGNEPTVILGIVEESDDEEHLLVQTARRQYIIRKALVQLVEDTEIPFDPTRRARGGNKK